MKDNRDPATEERRLTELVEAADRAIIRKGEVTAPEIIKWYEAARQLDIEQLLLLLETLAERVRMQKESKPKRSIMEFRGLGKEIWKGIVVEEYFNKERESWRG